MRRTARISIVLAFAALASAAFASPAADGTAFVVPTTAGAASHLHIDAKGTDGGLTPKEIPLAMGISFDRGFAFDPAAVAGTCSSDQAKNYACPADSVIANGSFIGVVTGLGFGPNGQPFNAAISLYKAAPQQSGDPMGVVFTYKEASSGFQGEGLGRLMTLPSDSPYGTALRFDHLPLPDLPPGLTITINEVKFDIGAGSATPAHSPKVTRKRKRHHHKKRRHCTKRYRHRHHGHCPHKRRHHRRHHARASASGSFLTNPATCTTGWGVQLEFDYKGHNEVREASVPCTNP